MPNVNKVTVMGVLGRNPETKQFPNGGSVTTFSVATSEFWKDRTTGERKEATEWHRITTNGRLADVASKYLKKGSKAYIEGSLRTRKWKDQRCRSGSRRDKGRCSAIAVMYFTFRPTAIQVRNTPFYNTFINRCSFLVLPIPPSMVFFGCNSIFKYYRIVETTLDCIR